MSNKAGLWIAAGCGVLAFLGLCVGTGVGAVYFFTMSGDHDSALPRQDGGVLAPPGAAKQDGPAVSPEPLAPPQPSTVVFEATIVKSERSGDTSSNLFVSGTSCVVQIDVAAGKPGMCKAMIKCGDRLLYGEGQSGFLPCERDSGQNHRILAKDEQATADDGDAAVLVDAKEKNVVVVGDDERGPLGKYMLAASIRTVRTFRQ